MAAISKISYLAIRSDSQNAVKRPNLVTLCSGLGWNSQSTTFFGRSLMFLMDFLTVQFLQNQLTIHQVSPFSVSNGFICFFFVFLFVSHNGKMTQLKGGLNHFIVIKLYQQLHISYFNNLFYCMLFFHFMGKRLTQQIGRAGSRFDPTRGSKNDKIYHICSI